MEPNSLDELYEQYVDDIYRYLRSLCQDHHAAEDLMQDTFYRAYLYLEDCREERIKPWLFRVAYNAFVDYTRKEKRSVAKEGAYFSSLPHPETTEGTLLKQERWEEVARALSQLPEGQRHALLLHDVHGLSYKEAADIMEVGSESIQVGDYSQKFLLGLANMGEFNWMDERNGSGKVFYYPSAEVTAGVGDANYQWKRLAKLPEGTVAEAYLSLDRLYTTDELLKQLEPLNLQPVWFGADAGPSTRDEVVRYPLGFPYQPMWHADDMKRSEVTKEKTGWFSSVSSYSSVSPSVESYGSGALRDANFIKTLKLLQQHQTLAGRAVYIEQLDTSVAYLEQNGVKLYGAVVTGPVKELLKLREASWVSHLQVGEVRLWNWQE